MLRLILFAASAYNLLDLALWVGWKIRLQPSFILHPASFWSSVRKRHILLFLSLLGVAAIFLYFLPTWLLIPLIPLSLLNVRRRKVKGAFPIVKKSFSGPKLFELDVRGKPHLLFIGLESFHSKSLGPLSPRFNELIPQGIYFPNFHSTGNLTNRCIISTLFGVPPAHLPSHLGAYCDLDLINLPKILSRHGYHPAWIQGGATAFDNGAEFFQKQGFKTIFGKRDINKPGTSWGVFDEHLVDFAVDWLERQTAPVFLNLYTITNHHPWIAPPYFQKHEDPFLNTFAYTDHCLGLLTDRLKGKNCILFIFGDHGQDLNERNPQFEIRRNLLQESVHVPLLILGKGAPAVIQTVGSHIDLLPTVLDLFSLKEPHQSLGKSLLRPSEEPIFFTQPFGASSIGCRKQNWKYILSDKGEELYDLEKGETENLIGKFPSLKEETVEFFKKLETYYSNSSSKKGKSELQLSFINSLITDRDLEKIGKTHPNLASINLSHCLLLTNEGIRHFLTLCPNLEKLVIDGLDEATGVDWPEMPHLIYFKALGCPNFQSKWLHKLPALMILQLGGIILDDAELLELAKTQKNLIFLQLENLPLSQESIEIFKKANDQLQQSITQCGPP